MKSIISGLISGVLGYFFDKNKEDELSKLRNENFALKLTNAEQAKLIQNLESKKSVVSSTDDLTVTEMIDTL